MNQSGSFYGTEPTRAAPSGVCPCATCSNSVDPLRAARVAIFDDRFHYFCSAECHAGFDPTRVRAELPSSSDTFASTPPPAAGDELRDCVPGELDAPQAEALEFDARAYVEQVVDPISDREPRLGAAELIARPDVGLILLSVAMLGGLLGLLLALAGASAVALWARAIVIVVALGALSTEYLLGRLDISYPSPLAALAAPVLGTGVAVLATALGHPRASGALGFAALLVVLVAASVWLIERVRRPLDAERVQLAQQIEVPAQRVSGDTVVSAMPGDLRPGEEILISAGETIPVDAIVVAGTALVLPWQGAKTAEQRQEGQTLVAGAQVLEGRLRAVVAWVGADRAWFRLFAEPRRRADLRVTTARIGRHAVERYAPLAAALSALTAYAGNQDLLGIVMCGLAGHAALANVGTAQIGSLHVSRMVLAALKRGIAFRSAEALDRTGRVHSAAFCARGTLLLGEPEVTNVEPLAGNDAAHVLSLLAGAESVATHPVAAAVLRAARARGVRPDAVRSPTYHPGLGVTAIAANGQSLVVGSRALMLKERISVAVAENKMTELEAMGRTVLLVALGSKLIGVAGLQDGLRPGARAAVQYLLDVGVEPVLLSGESRETCDALGKTLDIEHRRPEVLPADRGDEIRRLAGGGAVVAVIGRSPQDDAALAAADVSIVLGSAGSTAGDFSVELASEDVRDAAYAVRLATRCKTEGRLGLTMALAGGTIGTLAVAFSLTPPAMAPVIAFAGTLAAVAAWRGGL